MTLRRTWQALVGAGAALMLIALFMDTTVSGAGYEVHNIGLLAQQQEALILGGILLLGGIVLFGVMTLKQTPDAEARELQIKSARRERAQVTASAAKDFLVGGLHEAAADVRKLARRDNVLGRLGVALFVSVCLGPITLLEPEVWCMLSLLLLAYSLWNRPANEVMKTMLKLNFWYMLIVAGLATVPLLLGAIVAWDERAMIVMMIVIGCVVLAGISLGAARQLARKASQQGAPHGGEECR